MNRRILKNAFPAPTPCLADVLPEQSELADKRGIAKMCGVSPRTVENWVASRKIPHLKLGRLVRFRKAAVLRALERLEIKEVSL
jgi:excisionase family DNA binding protein